MCHLCSEVILFLSCSVTVFRAEIHFPVSQTMKLKQINCTIKVIQLVNKIYYIHAIQ